MTTIGSKYALMPSVECVGLHGEVRRAFHIDTTIDTQYIIKMYDGQKLAKHPELHERVLREISCGSCDHPNIAGICDVLESNGTTCIVMPYEEHCDIVSYVSKFGFFSENDARVLFQQLVSVATFCVEHNLAHCFTTDNISITGARDGTPKIRLYNNAMYDSQDVSTQGLQFRAPEDVDAQIHVCDVNTMSWLCGVLLYVLVTGRLPFHSQSRRVLRQKILTEPLEIPNQTSVLLTDLLAELLEKNPRYRCCLDSIAKHGWFTQGVFCASGDDSCFFGEPSIAESTTMTMLEDDWKMALETREGILRGSCTFVDRNDKASSIPAVRSSKFALAQVPTHISGALVGIGLETQRVEKTEAIAEGKTLQRLAEKPLWTFADSEDKILGRRREEAYARSVELGHTALSQLNGVYREEGVWDNKGVKAEIDLSKWRNSRPTKSRDVPYRDSDASRYQALGANSSRWGLLQNTKVSFSQKSSSSSRDRKEVHANLKPQAQKRDAHADENQNRRLSRRNGARVGLGAGAEARPGAGAGARPEAESKAGASVGAGVEAGGIKLQTWPGGQLVLNSKSTTWALENERAPGRLLGSAGIAHDRAAGIEEDPGSYRCGYSRAEKESGSEGFRRIFKNAVSAAGRLRRRLGRR
jgi:serine/threonine protein kinase